MGGGMSAGTQWLPPLVVLGLGLLAGIVLAFRMARNRRAATPVARPVDDEQVRDLRVQRDLLLAQLRDLDDTAGKRADDELARARYALELDAARTLQALDQAESAAKTRAAQAETQKPAAETPAPRSSPWVGALWGGGVVAFAAVLFFVLQDQMTERAAGGSLTGNDVSLGAPAGGQGAAQPDPQMQALVQRVQNNPQDIEAHLDLAQALLDRNQLVEVFQVAQAARALQPDNPSALTYEAVVRHAIGQGDQSMQLLDQAVAKDPTHAEAWVRRGLIAFELGRWDDAIKSWQTVVEMREDSRSTLEPVIAEARRRKENPDAPPASPHPPVAQAQPQAQAAADQNALQLVLELDPALEGKVPPGTPLFVSVRPAGVRAGPPAAARRLVTGTFPLVVSIGAGDTMMGQPLPASAYVEARIDADGNAMTRGPDDPTASADGVKPGQQTRLVLRAGQ